jgi:hypothetical protein
LALDQHHDSLPYRDVIGNVDFSLPSRVARFHLANLADGRVRSHRLAHGRGSNPVRTGWLKRCSNAPGRLPYADNLNVVS